MTDPRETLARIREQADAATPGPWEADVTGDVSQHWSRPEPWETVVGTDVACGSYCYGGSAKGVVRVEDAEFIAAARTTVPALLDLVDDLLERHVEGQTFYGHGFSQRICECGASWPCPDYTAATTALEGLHHA